VPEVRGLGGKAVVEDVNVRFKFVTDEDVGSLKRYVVVPDGLST
jgi:hypothetical protein